MNYLTVYVRRTCPACKQMLQNISKLKEADRWRVLVYEIETMPTEINGVKPTAIPVTVNFKTGKVHMGTLSKESLQAMLTRI